MTYEIKEVIVKHPKLGNLNKKVIFYYNSEGREITKENYEEGFPIKEGFKLKESK